MLPATSRYKILTVFILFGAAAYFSIYIFTSSFSSIPLQYQSMFKENDQLCRELGEFLEHEESNVWNSADPSILKVYIQLSEIIFKNCKETNSSNEIPQSTSTTRPKHCSNIPTQSDLNVTDIYWQVTNTTNGTFYLYKAYYDDRIGIESPPVVRILGMINRLDPVVKTYCQFWYENVMEPVVSEVSMYSYIWNRAWGYNSKGATPYLISCLVPKSNPPKFVSLTEEPCGKANNLLEVRNNRLNGTERENFIVSVKKLDYLDDVSRQIVEWCEIVKILGANKVEVSVLNVHPNVLKVLQFYEAQNFVTIKLIKYPKDLPNERKNSWHQWIQNELIAYHDTFYDNMHKYQFLIPMDTDEFIMPLQAEDRTWKDLLLRTAKRTTKPVDCYPVENHYFLLKSTHPHENMEGIPKNLYFLPNIYRAANFTPNGGNVKTFLNMERVLTIHNHYPFSCVAKSNNYTCNRLQVKREDGQLSHYRHDCETDECKASMNNPERDVSLWKYKNEILEAVKRAFVGIKAFSGGKIDFEFEYEEPMNKTGIL